MIVLTKNSLNRIFIRVAVISLIIIIVCRAYVEVMLEKDFFTGVGEFFFSVSYILVYISCFTLLISAIILVINFFKKNNNNRL